MSDNRDHLTQLARAWPSIGATARLRARPDDFVVDELLSFQPDGAGEHAFLSIRKTGLNTEQVARMLARHAGVRATDVGYAGLKDRHAVTTQVFTVYLPGREVDWQEVAGAQLEICLATRHGRKLRRGALAGNRFRLTLRDVAGDAEAMDDRLRTLRERGAPNYFMEQRFGRDAGNLEQARQMLEDGRRVRDRHLRGLFYSAARAYLFNQVLSRRCADGSWEQGMPGDCMMLDRSRAVFSCDTIDDEIAERVRQSEVHPTGPLWGRGDSLVHGPAAALEYAVLSDWPSWLAGLERERVDMARRRLRMRIADLQWTWLDPATLELTFTLGPGSYATAVIRELCELLTEDGSAA